MNWKRIRFAWTLKDELAIGLERKENNWGFYYTFDFRKDALPCDFSLISNELNLRPVNRCKWTCLTPWNVNLIDGCTRDLCQEEEEVEVEEVGELVESVRTDGNGTEAGNDIPVAN